MHPHMRSCFAMLGNTYATNDLGSVVGYLISQGIGSAFSMFHWPYVRRPIGRVRGFHTLILTCSVDTHVG